MLIEVVDRGGMYRFPRARTRTRILLLLFTLELKNERVGPHQIGRGSKIKRLLGFLIIKLYHGNGKYVYVSWQKAPLGGEYDSQIGTYVRRETPTGLNLQREPSKINILRWSDSAEAVAVVV